MAADDQATGTAPTRPERDKTRYAWLYDDEDIWAVGEEPDVFPVVWPLTRGAYCPTGAGGSSEAASRKGTTAAGRSGDAKMS